MTMYYDGIKFQNQITGAQHKLWMFFIIKNIKTKPSLAYLYRISISQSLILGILVPSEDIPTSPEFK